MGTAKLTHEEVSAIIRETKCTSPEESALVLRFSDFASQHTRFESAQEMNRVVESVKNKPRMIAALRKILAETVRKSVAE